MAEKLLLHTGDWSLAATVCRRKRLVGVDLRRRMGLWRNFAGVSIRRERGERDMTRERDHIMERERDNRYTAVVTMYTHCTVAPF